MDHVSQSYRKSRLAIWLDILSSSMKYNISILEYFNFHFYQIPEEERSLFAGTGFMYEYQLKMNPRTERHVLEDKLEFLEVYAPFIRHKFASLDQLRKDHSISQDILENPSGKIVLKHSKGQCGKGVEVLPNRDFTPQTLISRLEESGNDMAEEFVSQHRELMNLSPSGHNTIRIISQLDRQGQVHILGARLRITVNAVVDIQAAGNIAAPIDLSTGKVDGPGVYSDITKGDETVHPVTGVEIVGFQVPLWKESLQMIKEAAMIRPKNRSIGWDVAITDQGPELIEGNHDWCKLLWQLPVKKGLKPILIGYLQEQVAFPKFLKKDK